MIPGFISDIKFIDTKFIDIILDFYEIGIIDGIQIIREEIIKNIVEHEVKDPYEHIIQYLSVKECKNYGLPKYSTYSFSWFYNVYTWIFYEKSNKCNHQWVKVLVLDSDKEYWQCKKCKERNYSVNSF